MPKGEEVSCLSDLQFEQDLEQEKSSRTSADINLLHSYKQLDVKYKLPYTVYHGIITKTLQRHFPRE